MSDGGTVFKIGSGTTTITTVANFSESVGQSETGTLAMNPSGGFYGTISTDNSYDDGEPALLLFKVAQGSSTASTVTYFRDIGFEYSGTAFDSSGDLFAADPFQYGSVQEIVQGSTPWQTEAMCQTSCSLGGISTTNFGTTPFTVT